MTAWASGFGAFKLAAGRFLGIAVFRRSREVTSDRVLIIKYAGQSRNIIWLSTQGPHQATQGPHQVYSAWKLA
jgi:hypothetical protein